MIDATNLIGAGAPTLQFWFAIAQGGIGPFFYRMAAPASF